MLTQKTAMESTGGSQSTPIPDRALTYDNNLVLPLCLTLIFPSQFQASYEEKILTFSIGRNLVWPLSTSCLQMGLFAHLRPRQKLWNYYSKPITFSFKQTTSPLCCYLVYTEPVCGLGSDICLIIYIKNGIRRLKIDRRKKKMTWHYRFNMGCHSRHLKK